MSEESSLLPSGEGLGMRERDGKKSFLSSRTLPHPSPLPRGEGGSFSLSALYHFATQRLAEVGIETARLDAEVLLCHALQLSRETFSLERQRVLAVEECEAFESLLVRRVAREPLSYITGRREFWSLDFEVTPDTLIPRPDSETILETVLTFFPERSASLRVLDLGTGSGCLILSFLHEYPNATGVAVDKKLAALYVARRNAERLGLASRVSFVCSDWTCGLEDRFDVILANPPYVKLSDAAVLAKDVVEFEPHSALFAGEDGLDAYRKLGDILSCHLTPKGYAFVECGYEQAAAVVACLTSSHPLSMVRIACDLAGVERVVVVRRS